MLKFHTDKELSLTTRPKIRIKIGLINTPIVFCTTLSLYFYFPMRGLDGWGASKSFRPWKVHLNTGTVKIHPHDERRKLLIAEFRQIQGRFGYLLQNRKFINNINLDWDVQGLKKTVFAKNCTFGTYVLLEIVNRNSEILAKFKSQNQDNNLLNNNDFLNKK